MDLERARYILIAKIEVIRAELIRLPDCPEKEEMEKLLREMEQVVEERFGSEISSKL